MATKYYHYYYCYRFIRDARRWKQANMKQCPWFMQKWEEERINIVRKKKPTKMTLKIINDVLYFNTWILGSKAHEMNNLFLWWLTAGAIRGSSRSRCEANTHTRAYPAHCRKTNVSLHLDPQYLTGPSIWKHMLQSGTKFLKQAIVSFEYAKKTEIECVLWGLRLKRMSWWKSSLFSACPFLSSKFPSNTLTKQQTEIIIITALAQNVHDFS